MTTTQQPIADPATTPDEPRKKRQWYLRWWVWVVGVVFIVGAISAAVGGGGYDDAEPAATVSVPDLAEVTGDAAIEELSALGLVAELESTDGSAVIRPSNWSVVSIDPSAGTRVEAGSTVTVSVVKDLGTTALTKADIETLTDGIVAGRGTTIVGGDHIELPAALAARSPLAATARLAAVAVDTPDGRQYALFVTGGSENGIEGPIMGANDAATVNFDWGTAATADSPVGQFLAIVAIDEMAVRLLADVELAHR